MSPAAVAVRGDDQGVLPLEEIERRRLIVRKAHHNNQLEGIEPDPDMEPVFEDCIELAAVLPRIKAIQAARRG